MKDLLAIIGAEESKELFDKLKNTAAQSFLVQTTLENLLTLLTYEKLRRLIEMANNSNITKETEKATLDGWSAAENYIRRIAAAGGTDGTGFDDGPEFG